MCSPADLLRWERELSISAYLHPTVVREWAAHLAKMNDGAYQDCREALVFLHAHCRMPNGLIRFLATPGATVAQSLYHRIPPQESTLVHQPSKLVGQIALYDGQPLPPGVTALCTKIEAYITSEENRFVSDFEHVVQYFSSGYSGWDPFSSNRVKRDQAFRLFRHPSTLLYPAAGLVLKARTQLGVPHDVPDLRGMAQAVLHSSSATIEIYRNILEKLFTQGVGSDEEAENK